MYIHKLLLQKVYIHFYGIWRVWAVAVITPATALLPFLPCLVGSVAGNGQA